MHDYYHVRGTSISETPLWQDGIKWIVSAVATGGVLLLLVMGARCIFNH